MSGYRADAKEQPCFSYANVEQCMDTSLKNKAVRGHKLNASSSRGHTIFILEFTQKVFADSTKSKARVRRTLPALCAVHAHVAVVLVGNRAVGGPCGRCCGLVRPAHRASPLHQAAALWRGVMLGLLPPCALDAC